MASSYFICVSSDVFVYETGNWNAYIDMGVVFRIELENWKRFSMGIESVRFNHF